MGERVGGKSPKDWYRDRFGNISWHDSQEDQITGQNGETLTRLGKSGSYLNNKNSVTTLNEDRSITQGGETSFLISPASMSSSAILGNDDRKMSSPGVTPASFSAFDTEKTTIDPSVKSPSGTYGGHSLSYDIPIFAVPYMLLEAISTDALIRTGVESDKAQTTVAVASFLFTLKPGGLGNKINRTESSLGHIFRESAGHVNPNTITSQNRYINLFESVANNPKNINPNVLSRFQKNEGGFEGFSKTFRNGKQVWGQVRNGKIINAGVNTIPK